ncbi:VIT1/CCC1 transporter family protein [Corynebacterium parakroppenstedtii]|uniref:VIT1/CCC1 transporter family protein n=1 Tax=Corynebacterium parakroppenstedtii TaxID=2828363 RepID=UPI001C8F91A3|nr:VIT1/CCC1 transporter family protein [Corynebacterium parakroppenstedtii]MBY0794838.1 VIT1/CCC1 transporter family protein [Corynebacterium parakroppenstedtii]
MNSKKTTDVPTPTRRQINRWQRYLANERAEAAVYRELARKKTGEERTILLEIAEAEHRHEEYWLERLGDRVGMPRSPSWGTRFLGWMAKNMGSVWVLALMQSAETRSPYLKDTDATEQMIADEAIHAEVVRGLAARGRENMSGSFRAAVFGANDGLVSNLALVLGVIGSGISHHTVLVTGLSGLLAGALSMGAGEYVSVSSQRKLLAASEPNPEAKHIVPKLDMNANELALVYRARGYDAEKAQRKAVEVFDEVTRVMSAQEQPGARDTARRMANPVYAESHDVVGTALGAAISSFLFFASGAIIPVLPFLLGMTGLAAVVVACTLVGIALLCTGGTVGLLSGTSVVKRALFQLAIGAGAASVTFVLGRIFSG